MAAKKKVSAKKKTVSKKAASKASAKKAPAKKSAAKSSAAAAPKKSVTTPVSARMNKTQMMAAISDATGVSKKDVSSVIDELGNTINRHVKKGAVGEFVLPGLMKVKVVKKPAVKARKGINPFTGQEMMFKAKPARNVVKVLPLKALKEMAK